MKESVVENDTQLELSAMLRTCEPVKTAAKTVITAKEQKK